MNFDNFVKELQKRYPDCIGINNVGYDVREAERCEGDGDFILETNSFVIGKYIHTLKLFRPGSDDYETVKFCAYGIGTKHYETIDDYELTDYNNFEYIFAL